MCNSTGCLHFVSDCLQHIQISFKKLNNDLAWPASLDVSLDKFHCLDCEDDVIEPPAFWVGGRYTWDESKKKLISTLISPYLMLRCYLEFLKACIASHCVFRLICGLYLPTLLCDDTVTRSKIRKGMGTHHEEWYPLFSVVSLHLYIFGSCTLFIVPNVKLDTENWHVVNIFVLLDYTV